MSGARDCTTGGPETPARAGTSGVVRAFLLATSLLASALGQGAVASPAGPLAPLLDPIARAEASLAAGELQMAESLYRGALREGWLLLGTLAGADHDLPGARSAFEQAAVSASDTRRAHVSLALVHLAQGENATAMALLRGIVARRPRDGEARRLLAQAMVAAGLPEEALQELEEGLALGPEDLEIAFALATGYLRLGRLGHAEPLFAEVISQRPIAETHVLIGRTYRDYENHDRARTSLERALAIDPAVRRAHYYLGTLELATRWRDGLEVAIEHFRQELRAHPEDPLANLYLGLGLAETRHFDEALPLLEIARRWPATRVEALRFIGKCHLGLGEADRAAEVLRQALAEAESEGARPRQLEGIHYQLAVALRTLGAADEAGTHFRAAAEYSTVLVEEERNELSRFLSDTAELDSAALTPIAPSSITDLAPPDRKRLRERAETELARAYMNLGILQAQQNRSRRAADLLQRAAALAPGLPRLQYSLGVALFNAEQFDRATGALSLALEQDPSDAGLKRMLALARLNTEAYEQAAELLRDDPARRNDPSLQYAYGLALVRSHRASEAMTVFERLASEHASWPELHVVLGQAHAAQGDFGSAEQALRQALALRPDVAEASSTLGILYLRQGRLDEAEQALRAELGHRPRDVRSRYHLAMALELNRRPEAATDELRLVLRAQPDHADARYLLGKIYLAQGATDEAAAHLEAAAALAPQDANVHYQLAQAYQHAGKIDQAREQFSIYRDLKKKEHSDIP